jgi:hypothetical protein
MTIAISILALAGLFTVFAWLPLPDRGCDGCSGDCASCPLDEDPFPTNPSR